MEVYVDQQTHLMFYLSWLVHLIQDLLKEKQTKKENKELPTMLLSSTSSLTSPPQSPNLHHIIHLPLSPHIHLSIISTSSVSLSLSLTAI